ncbi:MAG: YkgJ family cysteine cluster protein, partial [Arenibacter sp.]|nr:YkgJ family cysteine cluster protein [Arenibacter sp.]
KHNENRKFFAKLRKKPPKDLDYIMQDLHEEEFQRTDCLECANCCKTTGPLFTNNDIERISKHFRMKPQKFVETYLRVDEEQDYVLQRVPCTFLGADNYCSIYDVRPKACREFPHTNRKKFHQISNLTLKNVAICPAAYNIVEEMKKRLAKK